MLYKLKCLKHRFIWKLSKRSLCMFSVSGSDLVQRWALDEVDGRLALFALQTQHVVGVTPAQNSRPLYVGAVHAPYTWETRGKHSICTVRWFSTTAHSLPSVLWELCSFMRIIVMRHKCRCIKSTRNWSWTKTQPRLIIDWNISSSD